jgi:hypothetical protein
MATRTSSLLLALVLATLQSACVRRFDLSTAQLGELEAGRSVTKSTGESVRLDELAWLEPVASEGGTVRAKERVGGPGSENWRSLDPLEPDALRVRRPARVTTYAGRAVVIEGPARTIAFDLRTVSTVRGGQADHVGTGFAVAGIALGGAAAAALLVTAAVFAASLEGGEGVAGQCPSSWF